jgi:hypothetical protein
MGSVYSYLPEEKEKQAIRAFYACIFDDPTITFKEPDYRRRFRKPIRMNAVSKLQGVDVMVILGLQDSPTQEGRFEGHPQREDPMAITIARLSEIVNDPEEYDEDFLAPTVEAHLFVKNILEICKDRTPEDIPAASPAPIGDGGIFLQWETESGCVQLVVPPDPRHAYLHIRKGSENLVLRESIREKLIDYLISIA